MKKLFYIFTMISMALFVYSAIHLGQQFAEVTPPHFGDIKGFEDQNPNDEYNHLVERFRQKIKGYEDQSAKDQNLYFWMSFVVTALTAGSTFISSIQAAKKEPATNPKSTQLFIVIIALLTFCSTLANFASAHFNDLKTGETKKAADLVTVRNQFYADYDKASPENKPSVITIYEQRVE